MKKEIMILILCLAFIPIINAEDILGPDITAEVVYSDPYPIEPGQDVLLSIEISNDGYEPVENIVLDLKATDNFSLLESSRKNIDILNSGKSRIVKYKLFVDSSASSGSYKIPLYIYTSGESSGLVKYLDIVVQGIPELTILDIESDQIKPGSQSTLLVTVKNIGTGTIKRATAIFSSDSEYINPIFSEGIAYIGNIEPGEEKQFEFTLFIDSATEFGSYESDINITYDDESGNSLSDNFDIGVLVSGSPYLQIIKTEVDLEDRELEIEIINSGSSKAIAIQADLLINNNTIDVDYITQVKIDKHATIKFDLPSGNRGQLRLKYKGPDNQEFIQIEDIVWSKPFSFPGWLKAVIILIIFYVIYKKRLWERFIKKKKK